MLSTILHYDLKECCLQFCTTSSGNFAYNYVLRALITSRMSIPLAFETVLPTLSEKCQLTPWDVRGKGTFTTLSVRFNEDTGVISDYQEPVSCVTRTERSRQVNSGVMPSVRRQDNSWQQNRRVNKIQLRKATFLRTTLIWKPIPFVCLSVPHRSVIRIRPMPATSQWS